MTILVERVDGLIEKKFNPSQPRDHDGQWTAIGGVAKLMRSMARTGGMHSLTPHDESDQNMDWSTSLDGGARRLEVVGEEGDVVQVDMPSGDLVKLHERLADSLDADEDSGYFEFDEDNEERVPVIVEWEKTRTFMGRQEYSLTFTHTTPEDEEAGEDEYDTTATLAMSERDMHDWLAGMTMTLLSDHLASQGHDIEKVLTPTLTKDFDPDQPRDDHGRWSKIGAAIDAISEAVGHAVRAHATFGGEEGSSDSHGLVTVHDTPHGRVLALNLHDREVGTSHVAVVTTEESEDLGEGLYDAAQNGRAGQSGSISSFVDEDSGEEPWWRLDYTPQGSTLHINLNDDDQLEEVLLSHDDADSLVGALEDMRSHDPDNPLATAPLPQGQTLGRRKTIDGGDRDVVLGVVSGGPDGDRLRLGLAGGGDAPAKRWTGGRGEMVADLGPVEAAALAQALHDIPGLGDEHGERHDLADAEVEAWLAEDGHSERLSELEDKHGDNVASISRGLKEPGPPLTPDERAELDQLRADRDAIWARGGVVEEGDSFATREIATPWGTVVVRGIFEYGPDDEASYRIGITVRPRDESPGDWTPEDDEATLYDLADVEKLRRAVLALSSGGTTVTKSAGGKARRVDNDRIAREGRKYWTRTPEGLSKWAKSAHPWTKLYRHLVTKMDPHTAAALTSSYFKAVFGYAPSARQGKNPVGKG